jgi:acetylornithine deacetylase/succinyl-diaminopimelate desuccinylase-like protein
LNLIELCRTLTAIDSSISHGTADIAEFVANLCRPWGLEVQVQAEALNGVSNANIFVRPKGSNRQKELVLLARLDTPEPGEYARWSRTGANPFNASIDGDLLFGLGLADAKADFACKLLALKEFVKTEFKGVAPVVVGTFGPSSGAGAIKLIRRKAVNAQSVLVGAPTGLQVGGRGPGYAKVEISIPFSSEEREYRERHNLSEGSVSQSKLFNRPAIVPAGEGFQNNPVMKLFEYLKKLPAGMPVIAIEGGASAETEPDTAFLELDFVDGLQHEMIARLRAISDALQRLAIELRSVSAPGCSPEFSTMTLGLIRTFPEEVRISGVCRLVPAGGRDVYRGWLEKLRQDCAATGAIFHLVDYKPPFECETRGAFFEHLMRVSSAEGFSQEIGVAATCTEANIFQRLGVESLVFGPGRAQQSHASEEHVNVLELQKAMRFYKRVIESYCQ